MRNQKISYKTKYDDCRYIAIMGDGHAKYFFTGKISPLLYVKMSINSVSQKTIEREKLLFFHYLKNELAMSCCHDTIIIITLVTNIIEFQVKYYSCLSYQEIPLKQLQ